MAWKCLELPFTQGPLSSLLQLRRGRSIGVGPRLGGKEGGTSVILQLTLHYLHVPYCSAGADSCQIQDVQIMLGYARVFQGVCQNLFMSILCYSTGRYLAFYSKIMFDHQAKQNL